MARFIHSAAELASGAATAPRSYPAALRPAAALRVRTGCVIRRHNAQAAPIPRLPAPASGGAAPVAAVTGGVVGGVGAVPSAAGRAAVVPSPRNRSRRLAAARQSEHVQ